MLNGERLKQICAERKMSADEIAVHLARGGTTKEDAAKAIRNWQTKLYKPAPSRRDIESLASALGVETGEISEWRACYKYAPSSPRKARLVTKLIAGRDVQDALDLLKFEHRRAASFIKKVLESAVANADENSADIESLYVAEARVDGAGRRIGTKGWIAKDRGRAHPIRKEASHIHITIREG